MQEKKCCLKIKVRTHIYNAFFKGGILEARLTKFYAMF